MARIGTGTLSKVAVVDLDSVEQMRAWLTYGPTPALARFVAMVRTALLVGDRVVVDRNQVLDGICFLALGPEGLRRFLGLSGRGRLPLSIAVQPPDGMTPADADRAGVGPGDDRTVDHQLGQVQRPGFASSAVFAVAKRVELRGDDTRSGPVARVLDGAQYADFDLLYGPAARLHGWDSDDPMWPYASAFDSASADIEAARAAWAEEIRTGAVDAAWWPDLPEMDESFWTRGRMKNLGPRATAVVEDLRTWSLDPSHRGTANRRGTVLGWVAERVRGAHGADENSAGTDVHRLDPRDGRMALKWWSLLYEDALQEAGGCSRIAFWNTVRRDGDDDQDTAPETDADEAAAERAWGLRKERPGPVAAGARRPVTAAGRCTRRTAGRGIDGRRDARDRPRRLPETPDTPDRPCGERR
ncbi:hypothetical protein [Brevibacterium litoralis]|uniref:hypothetical protein n=1 Tax=Brevibacterium litoralis TaxID=3138935 RepID=UPI0032EB0C39